MIHGYAGRLEEKFQHYRLQKEEKTDQFILNSFSQAMARKIYFSTFFFFEKRRNKNLIH